MFQLYSKGIGRHKNAVVVSFVRYDAVLCKPSFRPEVILSHWLPEYTPRNALIEHADKFDKAPGTLNWHLFLSKPVTSWHFVKQYVTFSSYTQHPRFLSSTVYMFEFFMSINLSPYANKTSVYTLDQFMPNR